MARQKTMLAKTITELESNLSELFRIVCYISDSKEIVPPPSARLYTFRRLYLDARDDCWAVILQRQGRHDKPYILADLASTYRYGYDGIGVGHHTLFKTKNAALMAAMMEKPHAKTTRQAAR
jgi:hypothetical protein